jgi:hypothetical protein
MPAYKHGILNHLNSTFRQLLNPKIIFEEERSPEGEKFNQYKLEILRDMMSAFFVGKKPAPGPFLDQGEIKKDFLR